MSNIAGNKPDYNVDFACKDPLRFSVSTVDTIGASFKTTEIICPKCGGKAKVDISIVLTSCPPKYAYYCEDCGERGYIFCDELSNYTESTINCLVCGEEKKVRGSAAFPYICDNCKKAIMKMRKVIED